MNHNRARKVRRMVRTQSSILFYSQDSKLQSKLTSPIRRAEFESYAPSKLNQEFIKQLTKIATQIAISTLYHDISYLKSFELTNQRTSELEINFPQLQKKIKEIFETNLNIKPDSITLYKSPEDGEERIIVTVPLEDVDDPLETLLSIKRKLRRIDRELAKNIVVLPSD